MIKKNNKVKIVDDFSPPVRAGLHFRILCLTGHNKGVSYYIKDDRLLFGRGDSVDIEVIDLKVSREHAELVRMDDSYILTDLGSQNGTIVNDLKIKQQKLSDGDKIVIGRTVYKYNLIDIEGEEEEYYAEDDDESIDEEIKLLPVDIEEATKKKKKLRIYIGVAIFVLIFLFDGSKEDTKNGNVNKQSSRSLSSLDSTLDKMIQDKMEEESEDENKRFNIAIHEGLREMRERNYLRSIASFEVAKVLKPKSKQAMAYAAIVKKQLDDEMELVFLQARREMDSLRYSAAVTSYCSIVRYLEHYKDDERRIGAEKNLLTVQIKAGLKDDEIKCFIE